jgi:hypothetical protein
LKPTEIPSGRIKRLNIQGAGDRPEYRMVAKLIGVVATSNLR